MRILDFGTKVNKTLISIAADELKKGGLIVYPTDTLYALGANALDKEAVKKVFEAKGREFNKPISIAVGDLKRAKKYFEFNKLAENIAKKFLPGPLTIILPSDALPKELSPTGKFSFRIPDSKVALSLLEEVNFPLTCTSANISGKTDPADAEATIKQIGDKVDLIIDAGRCKYGKPSTVIDLSDGKLVIVREGAVSGKDLMGFLD